MLLLLLVLLLSGDLDAQTPHWYTEFTNADVEVGTSQHAWPLRCPASRCDPSRCRELIWVIC